MLAVVLCATVSLASAATSNTGCLSCHGEATIAQRDQGSHLYINPQQFAATSHALIGCSSCHDAVTGSHPQDGVRPSRANCQECHGLVKSEYATTRHAQMAGCSDCHDPHRAKSSSASSGADMNRPCGRCHDRSKMVVVHSKWLPQTNLHMDALPCIACHTASKEYVIKLYLENRIGMAGDYRVAPLAELQKAAATMDLAPVVDADRDRSVSLKELRELNGWAKGKGMRVAAVMMPKTMTHSFQTLQNRWDCTFCHASGPKGNQESYLCLPQANGQFAQIPVQRGAVLELIYGTPDFYILGATRNTGLNILGGLIIAGGLMMPLGHGTFRFLSRRNRKEH